MAKDDFKTSPEDPGLPTGAPFAPLGICARCHRPLTRPSAAGGCLRCIVDFVALDEDTSFASAGADSEGVRRYSHFEIALHADGSLAELGHGAMGTTYRAQDTVLQSPVALKVISHNVVDSPAVRARFLREARTAARLRHPNVASVFHYGEQEGECFYVMELVEGETLEARVRRVGPLPATLVLEIGVQVARALAAAEAQGLVHRDLKPSNIMWVAGAETGNPRRAGPVLVKVIDFGLAKAVVAGTETPGPGDTRGGFVGTPAFASPEQYARAEDERIDTRSDIYSLGVTLWYLLCGKLPFVGKTLTEVHEQQTRQPLPLAQLRLARTPECVVGLLKSMLAAAPAARPQSARELLETLHRCQERLPGSGRTTRHRVHRGLIMGGAFCVAAVMGLAAWWQHVPRATMPTDASVAVLPFENLSPDPAEAFFTRGVQDKITADLARIARLKVIGPDSVKAYPPGNRDLPTIAQDLGVGHLLEGSVRREGEQIHIHVWLANARNSAQAWTGQYDRPLAEIFALQSEITREVADHLRVPLSPTEAADINQPPTRNLAAYDLLLRSREGLLLIGSRADLRRFTQHRIDLLDEAVKLDPSFVTAYCDLAALHDDIVHFYQGATAEERAIDHRALAEEALQKVRRLQPDSGNLHLVQAKHFLQVDHNIEQARIELDLARHTLPNSATVERYTGHVARFEGHWDEALRAFKRAASLEPRDPGHQSDLAATYDYLRDYPNFDRALAAMMALTPPDQLAELPLYRADGPIEGRADLAPMRAALSELRNSDDPRGFLRDAYGLTLALFANDPGAVNRVLRASQQSRFLMGDFTYPKTWFEALAARMRHDDAAAQAAFTAARAEVEKTVLADARDERNLLLLAMVDAGLGRKEEAVREAQRACAMEPEDQEPLNGPSDRCCLAIVYAWTDQFDLAFAELDPLVTQPAGSNFISQLTYGDLRLNPLWDPLRSDPRFAALVEKLAPPPTR